MIKQISILLTFLVFNSLYSQIENSNQLLKIKYYYTNHPIYTPHKQIVNNQNNIIVNISRHTDSSINSNLLNTIDSILKLSQKFNLRLKDSITDNYDSTLNFRRIIILYYQKKTIYISDEGTWKYCFKNKRYKNKKISKRLVKNKYVWINGYKTKNYKYIRKSLNIISLFFNDF